MKRSILVASLPHGPRDPVTAIAATGARVGAAHHQHRPAPRRRASRCSPHGRDLRTAADGTTTVLDEVRLRAELDAAGTITAIESDPPEPAPGRARRPQQPAGLPSRAPTRPCPHHREAATVLHQLLDDVPMAALINGYGWTRELGDDFDLPAESADRSATAAPVGSTTA